MCFTGSLALSFSNDEENMFSTGSIDIMTEIFSLDNDGKEAIFNEKSLVVMPGDRISYIPRIYNAGNEAYIRAKIDVSSDIFEISGISDKWLKIGKYYYYTEKLDKDETVKFFDSLIFNKNLNDKNLEGKNISITVTAEAVQAQNFHPDFSSISPFGTVEIKETARSQNITSNKISTVNLNNAANDIIVGTGFFSGLKNFMPGDKLTENVSIKNTLTGKAKYYITANTDNASEEEIDLLKKLKISIINKKSEILYYGSVQELKSLLIGEYTKDESDEITFVILVPEDLDSRYSSLNLGITWNFSKDYSIASFINPKTGDFKIDLIIIIFFISAIVEILICILYKKWRNLYE